MERRTLFLMGLTVLISQPSIAQDWNRIPGGNIINSTEWLGADVGSTIPLRIETRANQPIEWYTNAIRRMLLTPTLTGQTVNGYPGLDLSGNLGLGNFTNLPGGPPPLTMIHLDNLGTEVAGYRPWMHTGVGMTERSEWMYVGFKRENFDRIDAVINWADNREGGGQIGPDALRMVFTSPPTTTSVSGSLNGLEIARLIPAVSGNEGFFGIGDYFTAGLQPTERLDVLNGKVRIRQLPTDPVSTSNEYVTVNTTTGVLEHRPLPPSATAVCEWELLSGNRIATGYAAPGMNGSCPDRRWRVGIGTQNLNYKVDVFHSEADASISGGLSMDLRTNSNSWRYGIKSSVMPFDQNASLTYASSIYGELLDLGSLSPGICGGTAVMGKVKTSQARYITNSVGVGGDAEAVNGTIVSLQGGEFSARGNGANLTAGIGAYCWVAQNTSAGSMANGYGVYASSTGATTNYALYGYAPGSTNWAGYFVGRSFTSAGVWTPSDESLKSNIESIGSAMDRLRQLEPKT